MGQGSGGQLGHGIEAGSLKMGHGLFGNVRKIRYRAEQPVPDPATRLHGQTNVFKHGKAWKQVGKLKGPANPGFRTRRSAQRRNVLAGFQNGSLAGRELA